MERKPHISSIGVSALGFGVDVGLDWAKNDKAHVRSLITFLEDRRALTDPPTRSDRDLVVQSILAIRDELTATLQRLEPESGAAHSVRSLGDATRAFLTRVGRIEAPGWDTRFISALRAWRGTYIDELRLLADEYEITVHGDLAVLMNQADEGQFEY